jgi:hypothetical protein
MLTLGFRQGRLAVDVVDCHSGITGHLLAGFGFVVSESHIWKG